MPVFTIDAPLGAGRDAKQKMMQEIHDALDEAYHFPDTLDANRKLVQKIEKAIGEAYTGVANVDEVLVLINHYPLRNVGWRHSLHSDKPEIVAAFDQLNANAE